MVFAGLLHPRRRAQTRAHAMQRLFLSKPGPSVLAYGVHGLPLRGAKLAEREDSGGYSGHDFHGSLRAMTAGLSL
eukprot:1528142-Amphidinium_carterae.3